MEIHGSSLYYLKNSTVNPKSFQNEKFPKKKKSNAPSTLYVPLAIAVSCTL